MDTVLFPDAIGVKPTDTPYSRTFYGTPQMGRTRSVAPAKNNKMLHIKKHKDDPHATESALHEIRG